VPSAIVGASSPPGAVARQLVGDARGSNVGLKGAAAVAEDRQRASSAGGTSTIATRLGAKGEATRHETSRIVQDLPTRSTQVGTMYAMKRLLTPVAQLGAAAAHRQVRATPRPDTRARGGIPSKTKPRPANRLRVRRQVALSNLGCVRSRSNAVD